MRTGSARGGRVYSSQERGARAWPRVTTLGGRAWIAHVAHEPQSGPLGRRTATYRVDIAARRPPREKPALWATGFVTGVHSWL